MKIAFRTDASVQIGSGHVMRCLTLAEALRAQGATCHFICRELQGNLLAQICARKFPTIRLPHTEALPLEGTPQPQSISNPPHYHWLCAPWQVDASQTLTALETLRPDWLVVDHYALDRRWETAVRPGSAAIMVLDDLADRTHACDVLVDQNFGRSPLDYQALVPPSCHVLTGPTYAMLRPQFFAVRPQSLRRRTRDATLTNVLITLGGVDQHNATTTILQTLEQQELLPPECRITVILGAQAPWLTTVKQFATRLRWPTHVINGVSNMAQHMASADVAIAAAGGTALELCCLGVPTLLVALAQNQWPGARALQAAGACRLVGAPYDIPSRLGEELLFMLDADNRYRISHAAARITDGEGTRRVIEAMLGHAKYQ